MEEEEEEEEEIPIRDQGGNLSMVSGVWEFMSVSE